MNVGEFTANELSVFEALEQGFSTVTELTMNTVSGALREALPRLVQWGYVEEIMTPEGRRGLLLTQHGRDMLDMDRNLLGGV